MAAHPSSRSCLRVGGGRSAAREGSPQGFFVLGSASLAVGLALGGAFVASSLVVGVGALVVTGLVVRSSLRRSRWDPADPRAGSSAAVEGTRSSACCDCSARRDGGSMSRSDYRWRRRGVDVTPPLLLGFAVTILIRGAAPRWPVVG